jgi:hypothetical protein
MSVGRYWPFGLVCLAFAAAIIYLLLRRRVTLQASLTYMLLVFAIGVAAIFSPASMWIARHLGFEVLSNFFFAMSIGALSLLHLVALTAQSRQELRSIALTQELAILTEKLERLEGRAPPPPAPPPSPGDTKA